MAAVPTPDEPAVTSTDSPGASSAFVTIASWAVTKTFGTDAASAHDIPAGTRMRVRADATTNSA